MGDPYPQKTKMPKRLETIKIMDIGKHLTLI